MVVRMKAGRPLGGSTAKLKVLAILFRAIRLFIPSSETEYNDGHQDQYSCSCQDTVTFASHIGYTRLISKTCPVKPSCFLDY